MVPVRERARGVFRWLTGERIMPNVVCELVVHGALPGAKTVSIESWSENIVIAELQDDPGFADDVNTLNDQVETRKDIDVVLNFASVHYINSSNLAKLLKLRKQLIGNKRRLMLCGIATSVWGLFLVTGLDKVFEFADDVSIGLASVQIAVE